MNTFTPVQIVNDYLNSLESEEYPADHWRASSAGYCMRRVYFQRIRKAPTNPPDERTLRVFAAGKVFHEWMQKIMDTHYGEELTHAEANVLIPHLNVTGHTDNILKLNGEWVLVDYKTQHSGAFWHAKNEGTMMKPHQRLQMGTYLYALQDKFPGISGLFVYISKDDLVMEQVPLFWSDQLERDVERYWKKLNDYWDKMKIPPCTCEWEAKYCPYQAGSYRESYTDERGKTKYKTIYKCCEV